VGDTPSDVTVPNVSGADDQYRKPAKTDWRDNLRQGAGEVLPMLIPGVGGILGDKIADGAKVNEKDPSWEEVITMVTIPGRPENIRNASQIWKVIFSRLEQAIHLLEDGIGDLKSWEGEAGEAYRANLTKTLNDLKALVDDNKGITTSLDKAASELEKAIHAIPIPDDMAHEVEAAKQSFKNTGKLTNGLFSGAIFNKLLPIYSNKWVDELGEMFNPQRASHAIRDWISNEDDKAKAAYKTLAGQHVSTMDGMPQGNTIGGRNSPDVPTVNPTVPTPTGKNPTIPTTHLPNSTKQPNVHTPDPNTHLPNTQHPTSNPYTSDPSTPDLSSSGAGSVPSADYGSGLAGAGSGGLTGAGSGLGAGGLGAGGLGAGAGGLGAGTGGLGPGAGGLGAGAGGLGAGVAGARGGAGAGRAGAGMMGGGMGGGHGAGAGDDEEHSTWLNEDEDVWGSDTDAAPPVLGA
jgi:uncharacterized protein YukE